MYRGQNALEPNCETAQKWAILLDAEKKCEKKMKWYVSDISNITKW